MKHIGIVGAGIMASGIALNFLKHGYAVSAWNRNSERVRPLLAKGAVAARSPKDLAATADIVIECVSDDDASRSVWLGKDGLLQGVRANTVAITSATLSLPWVDELVMLCEKQHAKFLDMPLIGSRHGAENGDLTLLIGGDVAVLEEVRPDLQAISSQIFHFGKAGTGMRFKLLHNALIAVQVDAAAQAAAIAGKAGIGREAFLGALISGNLGPASPAVRLLETSKDWPKDHVNWAMRWAAKDAQYAVEMAAQYHAPFDYAAVAQKDFDRAKTHGLGDADWTKITEMYYHGSQRS